MEGLIHIYCGDGKGKTTSSIGLAIRCCGNGERVLMFQFLKGNQSAERIILKQMKNITLLDGLSSVKFTKNMNQQEKEEADLFYNQRLDELEKLVSDLSYRMLIMDEVIDACNVGFIKEEKLIAFLKRKPKGLEVVLTGRNPSESLLALADYVSDIKKIKHPFDRGILARRGIEL